MALKVFVLDKPVARKAERRCRVCGQPVSKPFRVIKNGEVVAGCVSEAHSGQPLSSQDRHWHDSPSARAIRARLSGRGRR